MELPIASIVREKIQVDGEEFSLENGIVDRGDELYEIRIPRGFVVHSFRRMPSNNSIILHESPPPQNGFCRLVCLLLCIMSLGFFIHFITQKN